MRVTNSLKKLQDNSISLTDEEKSTLKEFNEDTRELFRNVNTAYALKNRDILMKAITKANKITEKYIENEENREWIKENNPHAVMNIAEKLLEANQRNMWSASPEKLESLRKIYLSIEGDVEAYEE